MNLREAFEELKYSTSLRSPIDKQAALDKARIMFTNLRLPKLAPVDYGTIAMANAGPGTNGSQFFIVTKKSGCDWLNGKHTVFGKVIEGLEIAHDIENVAKCPMDNPLQPVKIKSVTFE